MQPRVRPQAGQARTMHMEVSPPSIFGRVIRCRFGSVSPPRLGAHAEPRRRGRPSEALLAVGVDHRPAGVHRDVAIPSVSSGDVGRVAVFLRHRSTPVSPRPSRGRRTSNRPNHRPHPPVEAPRPKARDFFPTTSRFPDGVAASPENRVTYELIARGFPARMIRGGVGSGRKSDRSDAPSGNSAR